MPIAKKSVSLRNYADTISKCQNNVRQGGQKASKHSTLPKRCRHSGGRNGKDGRGGTCTAA